jgi:ABC-2 type transport system permease protein
VIARILSVARKELLQLRRDRRTLPMIFVAPVLQLLIFGYAATQDIRNVRLAVADQCRTSLSREVVRALSSAGAFRVFDVPDRRAIEEAMLKGDATVGLLLPAGFERNLAALRDPGIEVFADGSEPNTAVVAAGYAGRTIGRVLQGQLLARYPQLDLGPPVEAVPRVLYNPDLRSRNFMVPGVLVMVLMLMTALMTSMAIVREYEHGTIEQLVVTPVRAWELLAGKLIPYIAIGYIDVLVITAVASAWFHVPIRGSVLLLFAVAGPFLLATLGLGILTSTVARTQQQSMMLSFFLIIPNILLSGFMFPIENMPVPAQYVTLFIPARYFLSIVRQIFLKGAGPAGIWRDTAALLLLGTFILALAVWRYRSRRT